MKRKVTPKDIEESLAYRRKHFAVEVTDRNDDWNPNAKVLSVTTNGTQWQSMLLLPSEVKAVIKALREAIR